jgi:hypothetical protein
MSCTTTSHDGIQALATAHTMAYHKVDLHTWQELDGFKQIDWGIKYNLHRYGSMCKALNHFKIKGWH